MKQLPQRLSLISQTVDILQKEITQQTWPEFLPGERELCERLHISRPTLREALELLQRDGWLEVAQGKRRRICQKTKPRSRVIRKSTVALLTPVPLHRMPPFVMFWVDELRERLNDESFELEIHVVSLAETDRLEHQLETLSHQTEAAAWVLFLSTEPVQRWFAQHHIPCVIAGSCFPGLRLPSVDIDSRSACRHAAGVFLAKGHRHLALLLPDTRTAGDQASEIGFREGADRSKAQGVRAIVVRHDETVSGVCAKIDALMTAPASTTALLVARSVHALTAMTHLQSQGRKIPESIAIISRDTDPFLEFAVPSLTRYSCNPAVFARRVSRLALQLAKEGTVPAKQVLLMPELIKGETVG